ncbi:GNAT family N-acetyltransferase [Ancylobacter sp.]|uniref:GNAT family N-acetyltransferase n=1 Tax=Ancylobacter sp. TaxID=1872567 RepID=UPI003D0AA29D
MTQLHVLSDLRDVPDFAAIVAERVWRAWWEADGVALATLRARLDESLGSGAIPATFVAHAEGCFLGCVALIASDVDRRPSLTPWVAALWVEPDTRRQGLGAALTAHAIEAAFAAGHAQVYLAAKPALAPYYLVRGWARMEADVDGLDILIRRRGG